MTPEKVVVAGDWHGNTGWAFGVIRRLPELLPDHPRLVLHAGDLGVWPGGDRYLDKLTRQLERADAVLMFVDGNHEDHDRLDRLPRHGGVGRVTDRILHLERGHRWSWHGRTWLALGGAASVDRRGRIPGRSWWPQEEITVSQATAAAMAGPADVMLTHDCPISVHQDFGPPPSWWDPADLARSDEHRIRLQAVAECVRPRHLIHGHLHLHYQRDVPQNWGPLTVTGLNCDGSPGNWAVLDARTMSWGPFDPGR